MSLPQALNTFLGPALIIILILIEYSIKSCGYIIVKKISRIVLVAALVFIVFDFISSMQNIILFESSGILWIGIAALFLFIYLFVILHETKIDNITGLDNRYSFFQYAAKLARNRSGESWVIIMLDINNFKMINNIYGYTEGDDASRQLAKIITVHSENIDFSARYGGDEFIIVSKTPYYIDAIVSGILSDLDIFNKKGEKPYNIEVNYYSEIFTTDGKWHIDDLVNNIERRVKNQNEESRRAGDIKQ